MREITTLEDQMKDQRRFQSGEQFLLLSRHEIEMGGGLRAALDRYGMELDNRMLPVFWHGREIGQLSAYWHPSMVQRSLMYEPRDTDFVRDGDKWIANDMLGPGDLLHAGVGFTKMQKPEW